MKKLLALLIVGGLLGLTTGCPSEPSTKPAASPPPKGTSPDKGMPPDKGPKETLPGKGGPDK